MLHDPTFELDIFKKIMKNLDNCEKFFSKYTKERIEDDAFQSVLVKNVVNDEDHSTLYMNNVWEFLQNQVQLYETEDIMFHPEGNERLSEVAT